MAKNTSKALRNIKNAFIFPNNNTIKGKKTITSYNINAGGSDSTSKNLSNYFMPIAPTRKVNDILTWRDSIREMEMAILPFRVMSQVMYNDTINYPQIYALLEKRYKLTGLRQYAMIDEDGNQDEQWTSYITKQWFKHIIFMVLDARLFGYTLISIGDIVDNEPINPIVIRRDNISPDRREVGSFPYDVGGVSWDDEPYYDNHIWVSTTNNIGSSSCGFGLLYVLTQIAILAKQALSDNADFMQFFAQPFRTVTASNNNEEERAELQKMMDNISSLGYAILTPEQKMEFHQNSGGNGAKSYGDFEKRMHDLMSKIILGHSDAIDSTPGKLGSSNGDKSPTQQSLYEVQQDDANFIEPVINEELIPRLRLLGINIPDNLSFHFLNSEEEESIATRKEASNLTVSATVKNLIGSNIQVDPQWFQESTGIMVEEITPPSPQEGSFG